MVKMKIQLKGSNYAKKTILTRALNQINLNPTITGLNFQPNLIKNGQELRVTAKLKGLF